MFGHGDMAVSGDFMFFLQAKLVIQWDFPSKTSSVFPIYWISCGDVMVPMVCKWDNHRLNMFFNLYLGNPVIMLYFRNLRWKTLWDMGSCNPSVWHSVVQHHFFWAKTLQPLCRAGGPFGRRRLAASQEKPGKTVKQNHHHRVQDSQPSIYFGGAWCISSTTEVEQVHTDQRSSVWPSLQSQALPQRSEVQCWTGSSPASPWQGPGRGLQNAWGTASPFSHWKGQGLKTPRSCRSLVSTLPFNQQALARWHPKIMLEKGCWKLNGTLW
jgi:hypothetical protein